MAWIFYYHFILGGLRRIGRKSFILDYQMTSVEKLTNAEYDARPGIRNSALNHFRRSAAHYKAYLESQKLRTPAMGFGDVLHKLVFQTAEFLPKLTTSPVKGRNAKKWLKAEKENPDNLYVTESEKVQIVGMIEMIQKNKEVMALLKGGHAEQSLFADHDKTSLQLKAKLDFLCADGKTILDLKTVEDAREAAFERSVARYGWAHQGAFYRKVAKLCSLTHTRFVFMAIEKSLPHCIMLHELEVVSMGYAHDKNEESLAKLKQCIDNKEFPGYEPGIRTITLPMYAMDLDDEL